MQLSQLSFGQGYLVQSSKPQFKEDLIGADYRESNKGNPTFRYAPSGFSGRDEDGFYSGYLGTGAEGKILDGFKKASNPKLDDLYKPVKDCLIEDATKVEASSVEELIEKIPELKDNDSL